MMDWDKTRSEALSPRVVSDQAESGSDLTDRASFLHGAKAIGLVGRRLELKPHQLLVPEVLDRGHEFNAVLMPRRSSKTTSVVAWALGRCFTRDDYLVCLIFATTAKKARTRFLQDFAPMMERVYPDAGTRGNFGPRGFKINRNAGMERIEFANGSVFAIIAPKGEDLRSDAWDVIIIDEAGEADPDQGEDLMSGALPTMDTRPGAQMVIMGTAGRFRKGNLLWDQLEEGRQGHGGILEFSAPDVLTAEDVDEWEKVKLILAAAHPGVASGLTTMDGLESRYRKMKRDLFMAEYASIFGDTGGGGSVISPAKWTQAEVPFVMTYPDPPERFTLSIAVTAGLTAGAIMAAWRDKDGIAHVLVLEHHDGIRWMAPRAAELSRKYRTPIVHDNFGSVLVVVEELHQIAPRPLFAPQTTRDTTTAAAKFVEAVDSGRLLHYAQDALTDAALSARKRTIGPKAWAFGRREIDDDICALEGASLALRVYDETPERQKIQILRPTAA
jgi:hypothetical protein